MSKRDKAIAALREKGYVVYDRQGPESWGNGLFDISGEEGDPRTDYWGNPCVEELQADLDELGLYAEWVNPGVLSVYNG